jgi:hypothetical protein
MVGGDLCPAGGLAGRVLDPGLPGQHHPDQRPLPLLEPEPHTLEIRAVSLAHVAVASSRVRAAGELAEALS